MHACRASCAWSNSTTARRVGLVAAVVGGVCLLTLSAKLQVPFYPVPMTMQTLVVLMIGMAYGRMLGTATVVAYLLAGAAGLPVFAGTPERGIGLAYMTGPTGGYLLGFLIASWLMGMLADAAGRLVRARDRRHDRRAHRSSDRAWPGWRYCLGRRRPSRSD
jgi:biotin transporter BioY